MSNKQGVLSLRALARIFRAGILIAKSIIFSKLFWLQNK
jgi:hypothetical protein